MKIKKMLMAALLAAVLVAGAVFAFAACGERTDPDPDPDPEPETKSYQLVGEMTDDLGVMGKGFAFMLDLTADGKADLDRYSPYQYDASAAATNPSYNASFMTGTWKAVDRDGTPALQIKLEDSAGGNASTSYAYLSGDKYSFELTFPIVVGQSFTRKVTLSGNETKQYADADAFIQAYKQTFTEPASVVKFTTEDGDSTLYVQEDGTVLFYAGYDEYATGTYYKTETEFGVIVDGKEVAATLDGNKATIEYTYSMGGGHDNEYTYVCDDISALADKAKPAEEGPGDEGDKTVVGTYNGENQPKPTDSVRKYKLELYSDGTCKITFTAFSATATFNGKYVKDGTTVTLSEITAADDTAGMLINMAREALVWTVNDADGTMTVKAA